MRTSWKTWTGFALLGCLLGSPSGAWGATVTGYVRDQGGSPLPGVLVRILEDRSRGTRTDAQGSFTLSTDPGDSVTLLVAPDALPAVRVPGVTPRRGELSRVDVVYLTARAGAPCSLDLSSNPSTGYGWALVTSEDLPGAATAENTFMPPESPGNRPLAGRGGLERWTFCLSAPGFFVLRLAYLRPWEQGVPPARLLAVAVTVTP